MPEENNGKPKLMPAPTIGRFASMNAAEQTKRGMIGALKKTAAAFKNALTGTTQLDLLKKLLDEKKAPSIQYKETGRYTGQMEYQEKMIIIRKTERVPDRIASQMISEFGVEKFSTLITNYINDKNQENDTKIVTKDNFSQYQYGDYTLTSVTRLYWYIQYIGKLSLEEESKVYAYKDTHGVSIPSKEQCKNLSLWCIHFLSDYQAFDCKPITQKITNIQKKISQDQIQNSFLAVKQQYNADRKFLTKKRLDINISFHAINILVSEMQELIYDQTDENANFDMIKLGGEIAKKYAESVNRSDSLDTPKELIAAHYGLLCGEAPLNGSVKSAITQVQSLIKAKNLS